MVKEKKRKENKVFTFILLMFFLALCGAGLGALVGFRMSVHWVVRHGDDHTYALIGICAAIGAVSMAFSGARIWFRYK